MSAFRDALPLPHDAVTSVREHYISRGIIRPWTDEPRPVIDTGALLGIPVLRLGGPPTHEAVIVNVDKWLPWDAWSSNRFGKADWNGK
jgi:hypothetical protein